MLANRTDGELLNIIKTAYEVGCLDCFKGEVRELIRRQVAVLNVKRKRVSFDPLEIMSAVILSIVWLVILLYILVSPLIKLWKVIYERQ